MEISCDNFTLNPKYCGTIIEHFLTENAISTYFAFIFSHALLQILNQPITTDTFCANMHQFCFVHKLYFSFALKQRTFHKYCSTNFLHADPLTPVNLNLIVVQHNELRVRVINREQHAKAVTVVHNFITCSFIVSLIGRPIMKTPSVHSHNQLSLTSIVGQRCSSTSNLHHPLFKRWLPDVQTGRSE